MSSPEVHLYNYSKALTIFPEVREEAAYEGQFFNGCVEKKTNYAPLVIALGAIILLCGLFLVLSAHQLLPLGMNSIGNFSVNSINNFGLLGKIVGYAGIGLGGALAVGGGVKALCLHREKKRLDRVKQVDIEVMEDDRIRDVLCLHLETTELLATIDPERKIITVYLMTEYDGIEEHFIEYTDNPEEALKAALLADPDVFSGKQFVTLETLQQRISSHS